MHFSLKLISRSGYPLDSGYGPILPTSIYSVYCDETHFEEISSLKISVCLSSCLSFCLFLCLSVYEYLYIYYIIFIIYMMCILYISIGVPSRHRGWRPWCAIRFCQVPSHCTVPYSFSSSRSRCQSNSFVFVFCLFFYPPCPPTQIFVGNDAFLHVLNRPVSFS